MAMFDNDQPISSGPGTVVGANVNLTGTLKDVNDITIHGHVDGEVISEKNVNITETASVKGPITAEVITVSGKINGAITAQKKLEINPTGKVYGSITTSDLIIHSGAIFVGKSNTLKEVEPPEKEEKIEKDVKIDDKKNKDKKDEPKYEVE